MSEAGPHSTEPAAQPPKLSLQMSGAVFFGIVTVALASLYYFYSRGLTNNYGDGLAHVEGARRLFDSMTPGYAEIGSAWLPLYHILAAPLALNDHLWKTGLAGSLVSLVAFVVAAWFLFRFSFELNHNLLAGVLCLVIFCLCPSMAFLASVPLTESLALMWAVLMVYGLFRFQQSGKNGVLIGTAFAAFFGTLTRYDGWFLLPFAAAFVFWARSNPWRLRLRHTVVFSVIAGIGPLLWFIHGAYRYGNALDFYNGPHSAKAFYAQQLATTGFRYPTDGSYLISARYYLADVIWNMGAWPLELALLGLIVLALDSRERRERASALLLFVPFIFYVQSMAHSAVPIYVPSLFPFTYYNLRYGIEMLPAVAIFPSFLLGVKLAPKARAAILAVIVIGLLGQDVSLLSQGAENLAVVQEGIQNNPCRSKRQQTLIQYLSGHYDGQIILVASGKWPCVMPQVGIPFRNTLSEPNVAAWQGLRNGPPLWVGWIIRGNDDEVDQVMRAYPTAFNEFKLVESGRFPGEGSVEIYRRAR